MRHSSSGAILHRPALYDWQVRLFTLGRDRSFRRKIVSLARLSEGDSVLDVGCGTGTLAIEANRRVGLAGSVQGIDPSLEMTARAAMKARRSDLAIDFVNATAQALPFPDDRFDIVLSTLMLHHLPRRSRAECAREMRRVVKPDGRVLVVEFGAPARPGRGIVARFHRHGHVAIPEVTSLLSEVGLEIVEQGAVGFDDIQFVLAQVPAAS